MTSSRVRDLRRTQVWVIAVVAVVLLCFYLFGIRPTYKEIERKRVEYEAASDQLQHMQRAIARWEQTYGDYQALQLTVSDFKGRVPNAAEIPLVMEQLDLVAQRAGLVVGSIVPGSPNTGERYVYVPMQLILTGTYGQVIGFFAALKELPFPVDIHGVNLAAANRGSDSEVPMGETTLGVQTVLGVLLAASDGGVTYSSQR